MNHYKVAVFDLDGTLFNNQSQVSPQNLHALKRLKETGMLLGIASGRDYAHIATHYQDLANLMDFIVEENGTHFIDLHTNKETLTSKPVDSQQFANFYQKLSVVTTAAFFNEKGKPYGVGDRDVLDFFMAQANANEVHMISTQDLEQHTFHKIVVAHYLEDSAQLDQLVSKYLPHNLSATKSVNFLFEIQDAKTTKSSGIQSYIKTKGIDMNEVIAFGDGDNDLSMIQDAGLGVAMKNAMNDVKKVANMITEDDANRNGVAKFIEKYFFHA